MIKLIGLAALGLGFILHFVEWLYDFKLNGWSFATVISIALLIERTHHNHQTRVMLKIIGEKVGVAWESSLRRNGLKVPRLFFKKPFLFLQTATIHLKQRRMSMLKNILKANLSKKLISAIVSMSIASLNYKYHLNIPEEVIWGILGLSLTHISLQTIIDSIKAWAISKADITIRQTAPVIEKVLLDPNTTYKDLFPKVKEVHAGLQKIYEDIKKNDGSQAFKDASQAYLDLHDIFQSIKPPDPIAVIVEDKVAS